MTLCCRIPSSGRTHSGVWVDSGENMCSMSLVFLELRLFPSLRISSIFPKGLMGIYFCPLVCSHLAMVCPGWAKEGCYTSQTVVGTLGAAKGLLQLECSQSTTAVARNATGSSTTTSQSDGEFLCFFQQHCQHVCTLSFPGLASVVQGWCWMKCFFCNIEKVWLLEKQALGCFVGVFFPLLFIPLLSVSREFQIRMRTSKYQMSWKIPCVGPQKYAVYEVCVYQCCAKFLPSWFGFWLGFSS